MANNRIMKIKERLFQKDFEEKKAWWGDGETILTSEEVKKEPLVVRKAMATAYTLEKMPICIKDYELIVGKTNMGSTELGRTFPDYALPEEKEAGKKLGFDEMSIWGHHPANYEKLLKLGLKGYRERIYEKIDSELDQKNPDREKLDRWRAMLLCLDGVSGFAARYSALALEMALNENNQVRRDELFEISKILKRVPENPPETLHEALQTFWTVYCSLHSTLNLIPAGRSDQYFYPFYKSDKDKGTLTDEHARDLIASWLSKFSDRIQNNSDNWDSQSVDERFFSDPDDPDESVNYGIGANSWLMNAILGGLTPEGEDGTNELTYMILDVWNQLELISPVMSVRFSKKSPEKLYIECAKILRCGSGEPALYSDEPIIEGLLKKGISLEDARGYSNDGCWEVLVPGKTDHSYQHILVMHLLEYTLFRGRSLLRDRMETFDSGDPLGCKTYDEFYELFMAQVRRRVDELIDSKRESYGKIEVIAPDPLLSVFMDDCVERGKDISNGGAKYVINSPIVAGLANCSDCLASIKMMVFDNPTFSMQELLNALETNFEGKEAMRQQLINWVPKFGNDDDYVDSIASKLLSDIAEYVKKRESEDDTILFPMAIGTFERYAFYGMQLGASADGRKAGDTLAANYSPAVGMDLSGPTAVVQSIAKPDLMPYIDGCPVDIQINSNEFTGDTGITRLVGLIKSFKDLGGLIFTITGVSEDVLQDAKLNPDKHKGLRVRIGGYSGYFVALPPMHQDVMIERIKHGI